MRDLLVFVAVFGGLALVFSRAYVGVYLWIWIALMAPHKLAWGPATQFPFAMLIGIVTVIGLFISKQPRLKIWQPEMVVIAILVLWVTVNAFLLAFDPSLAYREWDRFVKTQAFVFLTVLLISDRKKLDGLIWLMALSVGYNGIKGGIFTILTGGAHRVWGPSVSFFADNNTLGLALLMTVPLFRYLYLQQSEKWIRYALMAAMVLCMVSIVGTQSRGALVGIIAIGVFLTIKSRKKFLAFIAVLFLAVTIAMFMPQSWWDRMGTIQEYEQDESASSRINAWWVAWNVATRTFVGGGPGMWNRKTYALYDAPDPNTVFDVHSIYFEMLGEQGFPGLFLFLLLGWMVWRRCARLVKAHKDDPEKKWAADLAAMLQVSFVGYATSGAFLGLAYFDYYYYLIAVAVIVTQIVDDKQLEPKGVEANRRRSPAQPQASPRFRS